MLCWIQFRAAIIRSFNESWNTQINKTEVNNLSGGSKMKLSGRLNMRGDRLLLYLTGPLT